MKNLPVRSVPYGTAFKVFGDEFIALDYIDGAFLPSARKFGNAPPSTRPVATTSARPASSPS